MRFRLTSQAVFCILLVLFSFKASGFQYCSVSEDDVIKQLGWIQTNQGRCGGYYQEAPFLQPTSPTNPNVIEITSDQFLFAQHGTSVGQGKVTISRFGQQVIANKAYVYRDPTTGKLSAIELLQNVTLREPNSLIVANHGRFNLQTKAQSLHDILYRTTIYADSKYKKMTYTREQLEQPHEIYQLSAWGRAEDFNQEQQKIYEFFDASYTTCAPTCTSWRVRASHIVLDENTGRGTATNARLLVRGVPVFYTPYINFPIDSRRKTGFLWPTAGSSSRSGPYFSAPFYWNLAPNYDTTITPAFLSKRGVQIADLFRYLTPISSGNFNVEVLPGDRAFKEFQQQQQAQLGSSPSPIVQSELRTLQNDSTTRSSVNWVSHSRFNDNWTDSVDFNWVSDDYYLRDFNNNLNQVTENQLLQQGELDYKGPNWLITSRVQAYQTMHPVDETILFENQYMRLPDVVLDGDYPNSLGGLDYLVYSDLTHFDIRNNPGIDTKQPIGNRLHLQPGVAYPFNWNFLTVTPRLQFAMTKYELGNVMDPTPNIINRTMPIFDVNSSMYFDRNVNIFNHAFRQTLEPQLYYVYIPFRNQNDIPIFDTTVNTLTYDQLFLYNRFSGIDRINDANRVTLGVASRFLNPETGTEKAKVAIGQIYYFTDRKVTLCSDASDPLCSMPTDVPGNPDNLQNKSPITALLSYAVNQDWTVVGNTIWDVQQNNLNNQSIEFHYQPPGDGKKIVNMGYNFVRKGDIFPTEDPDSSASNMSQTDLSFNWPLFRDWGVYGRWTQNWNHNHFQNLLYGLQYDTCCWAMRIVAGRAFTNLTPNNTFQYNTQFYLQFALKGLGSIPVTGGDPSLLLSNSISGYQNNFGRDF